MHIENWQSRKLVSDWNGALITSIFLREVQMYLATIPSCFHIKQYCAQYSFRNNFRILFIESSANDEWVCVDHYLVCNRIISRELFGVISPRDSSSAVNMQSVLETKAFELGFKNKRSLLRFYL